MNYAELIMCMRSLKLRRIAIVTLSFGVGVILAYSQVRSNQPTGKPPGFIPKEGFVPNAEVAQAIAGAVLLPVYGEETINSERPFKVSLKDDVWTVTGSVPCENPPAGAVCPGGSSEVRISKKTGQILYMTHSQ
jgi:NTF2 fold immunity protein